MNIKDKMICERAVQKYMVLLEMPYIFDIAEVSPDSSNEIDLGWEQKEHSVALLIKQFEQLFLGKEYSDDYGNKVVLKTAQQRRRFINKILNSDMAVGQAKKNFHLNLSDLRDLLYRALLRSERKLGPESRHAKRSTWDEFSGLLDDN